MFIATFLLTTTLAIAFFSAENLVTTLVGFVASMGLTQWIKNSSGAYGTFAAIIAFVVSFVVAIVALVISTFLSGGDISWEMVPQAGLQIFALATMAYKLFLADNEAGQ